MADNHFKINKGVSLAPQPSEPSNPTNGDIYYDSSLNQFRKYENGSWTSLGSGSGAGGINYITNGDAEANADGWATYADAAGTSPVDGTGGSPNVTFTRSTSLPLRGLASFIFAKDAANRQGQGASYQFTIDSVDQGRMQQIKADFSVLSGTYADGDLKVYIYDITNGQVIEPAGYSVLNFLGSGQVSASFQAAINSTSYRLIFHVSSTSALAYSLKIDNISVGPNVKSLGYAASDLKSTTTTIVTSGTAITKGTIDTDKVSVRKDGQFAEITIVYRQTAGGSAGSGSYFFSMPFGLVVDTSALGTTANAGYVAGDSYIIVGSTRYEGSISISNDGTTITPVVSNDVSPVGGWNATTHPLSGTYYISCNFRVPIVGWSSNVEVSSDTDTRVVGARIRAQSALAVTQANQGTSAAIVKYLTADADTHGGYNPTTGEYTIQVPGYYDFNYGTEQNSSAGSVWSLALYKNGGLVPVSVSVPAARGTTADYTKGNVSMLPCVAGDVITVRAIYLGGKAGNYSSNNNLTSEFTIQRVSGPSQIAASESVNARYTGSSTSVGTSATIMIHPNKVFDTHNAYNTSTGRFSCPMSGKYEAGYFFQSSASISFPANNTVTVEVYKNGSFAGRMGVYTGAAYNGGIYIACTPISVDCVAGDLLDVRVQRTGAVPAISGDSGTAHAILFRRVGN